MNNYVDTNVICPYYKKTDRQVIFCEGVEENASIRMSFSSNSQKNDYMKEKCMKCWGKCLWADALNRKWDDT